MQTVINSLSEKKGNKLFTSNKPSQYIIDISKNLEAEVYIDPLIQKPRLVIFGAGHIARPLAKMGEIIGFKILVMDDREDMVNKTRFPEADCLICRKFEDFLSDLKIYTNDYLVIVTRGHQHDYLVLRKVIDSRAKYIGMVGSSNRVNIIFERLQKVEGVKEEYIKRVQAPIGIPIASETPEEIAVSIIAQLIATRRKEGYNG